MNAQENTAAKAQGAEATKKARKFTVTIEEMTEIVNTEGLQNELKKIAELMEGENLTAQTLLRIAKANLKQLEIKLEEEPKREPKK